MVDTYFLLAGTGAGGGDARRRTYDFEEPGASNRGESSTGLEVVSPGADPGK